MKIKKIICIILLFLLLFSTLTLVSADDDDRSYTIDWGHIDLDVGNNGMLHVNETYYYTFKGTYNGVYRDIPLKEGESIENIQIWADGAYPVLEESDVDGKKHLKIYLYADEEHTQPISDTSVTIYISYNMKHVITLFNDVGALQFKLWGEEWDVDIGKLTATINLPGKTGNSYYLNPQEFNVSSSLTNGKIEATTTSIPKGDFYELLVLMPLSDFNNATYAKHVNSDGKAMIEKNLNDSINSREMWNNIYLILGLLSLLSPISAIVVYLKYGREPKVNYNGIYERELPTDDPPAMVNAMLNNKIGNPDIHGFEATILNLIDKKVIDLETQNNEKSNTKELILKLDESKSENLAINEKNVINTLYRFSTDGVLNLSELNSQLSNRSNAEWFLEQFRIWQESIKSEYLNDNVISSYFNDSGSSIMNIISIVGFIAAIIMIVLGFTSTLSSGLYTLAGGILLIIFSAIVFLVPDDIFGQWTEKGRLFYLKWKNFKKFLNDNSLIKEHPPESIVVWNKYLIYGSALGVAEKVYKSMKLQVPNIDERDDNLYMYHYYGGYYLMYNAFETSHETVNPSSSDSGSFGSIGGGSGGGGGGAF